MPYREGSDVMCSSIPAARYSPGNSGRLMPALPATSTVSLPHWARLHLPDVSGVFSDCAVTRELSRAGYIQDGFLCPCVLVVIQLGEALMRLDVGRQVRQVHVV